MKLMNLLEKISTLFNEIPNTSSIYLQYKRISSSKDESLRFSSDSNAQLPIMRLKRYPMWHP